MASPNIARIILLIIAAIAALIGLTSNVKAEGYGGYVLPDGCVGTVVIHSGRGFPDAPITAIESMGGIVVVDESRDPLITLTITGWIMHEDGDWGDLRSYEVEGTCRPVEQPTRVVILYIDGQAGDPEYDEYAKTYGGWHICRNIGIVDDVNSTISPYIYSIELCQVTDADLKTIGEDLGDTLLTIGYPTFLPVVTH